MSAPVKTQDNNNNNDYHTLTEVEWGPSRDDPAYDTDQELAPKPKRSATERCNCPPGSTCLDTSCVLFCCQEECSRYCPAAATCRNRRLQKKELLPPTQVIDAGVRGRGLVVLQDIPAGTVIIEYTGQAILQKHLNRLFRRYQLDRRLYIMSLGDGVYLDARQRGGPARFINHSCRPNCRVERWKVKGILRAAVVATENIKEGQELTFDYQWERQRGRAPTVCHCGEDVCRGTLELKGMVSPELVAMREEGEWKEGRNSTKESGVVAPDRNLVNRMVQVYSKEHEEYFLGEVTGYREEDQMHYILYHEDLKEVWEDLSKEDWMVLDNASDKEHYHIAKKSARRPSPTSSLLLPRGEHQHPSSDVKDYMYVQTPMKEALLGKIYVSERCQRLFRVNLSASPFSRPPLPVNQDDPEDVEKYQALDDSLDGMVWKISLQGDDIAGAYDLLVKNISYFEKKLADEEARSKTPPPQASETVESQEFLIPNALSQIVKRKLPSICRNNVTFQLILANNSQDYARVVLSASLASDLHAVKDPAWSSLLLWKNEAKLPTGSKLGCLAGSLTESESNFLLTGNDKDENADWTSSPFVKSFESTNSCSLLFIPGEGSTQNVYLGCSPAQVSQFWGHLRMRIDEVRQGNVRYYHLGITDRVFQPMLLTGGKFFAFLQHVTGVVVTMDSLTGDHLKLDGRGASSPEKAALAEEIVRLQLELFRDRAIRKSQWIFGRDWTLTVTSSGTSLSSSAQMGPLDAASASQGAVEIAEIVSRLNLPQSVAAHAVTILYRFVVATAREAATQSKQRDVLLACIFLASKAQKKMKAVSLDLVLEAGYMTIYRGATFDSNTEEASAMEERVIAVESEVLETLKYDIFWQSIECIGNVVSGSGGMKEELFKSICSFAFSSQILAAGPDLWLKYGVEYVFAASAAFLKVEIGRIVSALSLMPLKISQAAELIIETAKLGAPRSKECPSHKMLERNKQPLQQQIDRIKQSCMDIFKTYGVAGSNGKQRIGTVAGQRFHIIAKRNSLRSKFVGLDNELVRSSFFQEPVSSPAVLSRLDEIGVESGANLHLVANIDPGKSDLLIDGNWRSVAIAQDLVQERLSVVVSPVPGVADDHSKGAYQVKMEPGIVSPGSIKSSSGWNETVASGTVDARSGKLGGKSCEPGIISESSMRRASLGWWSHSPYGIGPSGSLTELFAIRTQKENHLSALALIQSSIVGEDAEFPLLQSFLPDSKDHADRMLPVSLQRWPPEKLEKSEKKRVPDKMQVGFSPVALQELQLLTELHCSIPTPQGHPNLILPVAVSVPFQKGEENLSSLSDSKSTPARSPEEDPTASMFALFRSTDTTEDSNKESPYIIYGPVPFSLQRFVSRRMKDDDDLVLSPIILTAWCHDILSALVHCHTNDVVLRTLQPDQIVVDHAGVVKLGSFYRCTVLSEIDRKKSKASDLVENARAAAKKKKKKKDVKDDNLHYLCAPELLLGSPTHTKESDIWSIGCLLGSLMLNRPLFRARDRDSFLFEQYKIVGSPSSKNFEQGKRMPYYKTPEKKYPAGVAKGLATMLKDRSDMFEELAKLVAKMLCLDPSKRCTAEEALSDECMTNYVEKCHSNQEFRQNYVQDWLKLKRGLMHAGGSEYEEERSKKRKALIAAASDGKRDSTGDDLYDMDDLLDVMHTKKAKT